MKCNYSLSCIRKASIIAEEVTVSGGKAIMTIFGPNAGRDTFTVDRGEIVFVPRGYLHHIENIGTEVAKFVLAFSHEKPEDLGITGSIGSMPNPILDLTFSQSSSKLLQSIQQRIPQ